MKIEKIFLAIVGKGRGSSFGGGGIQHLVIRKINGLAVWRSVHHDCYISPLLLLHLLHSLSRLQRGLSICHKLAVRCNVHADY